MLYESLSNSRAEFSGNPSHSVRVLRNFCEAVPSSQRFHSPSTHRPLL